MDGPRALVFCGGGAVTRPVPAADLVIAADSGAAEAHRLERRVDLLVGDMDSIAPEDLERLEREGATIERSPADKDATDLELALDAAVTRGAQRISVAGGSAGRLDHLLANVLLLAGPRFAGVELDAILGPALVHVVRRRRELEGVPGELVTLLPLGGPAKGVRTRGLRWVLDGDDLPPGSSRGVSNEFVEAAASIELGDGVLVAIRPGADA